MLKPTLKSISPVDQAQSLQAEQERLYAARLAATETAPDPRVADALDGLWRGVDALALLRVERVAKVREAERIVVAERADDIDPMRARDASAEALLEALVQVRLRLRNAYDADAAAGYGFGDTPTREAPGGLVRYAQNAIELLKRVPFERADAFGFTLTSAAMVAYLEPPLASLEAAIDDVDRERAELTQAIAQRDAAIGELDQANRALRLTLDAIAALSA